MLQPNKVNSIAQRHHVQIQKISLKLKVVAHNSPILGKRLYWSVMSEVRTTAALKAEEAD